MCDTCNRSDLVAVAKSDLISVSRCRCGRYWLHETGEWWRPASEAEQALAEIVAALVRLKLPAAAGSLRARTLSTLFVVVILSFVGFHDWNGNGVMDDGEEFAEGRYEIYRTAADGAVDVTFVQYPAGVPFHLAIEPGDQLVAASGCGSWAVDTSQATTGVPVICRPLFLPLIVR
ncbi:MAG: hypothetical protein DCC55_30800 [Chloroflexi bacterium]|nr:MAG: hypothetical protein DCC55_30800 [Chloroflexota bacterium]